MPNSARLSNILLISDSVKGSENWNNAEISGPIFVRKKLESSWCKAITEPALKGMTNSSKPSKSISALIIPLGIKPIGAFRSKG